MISQVLKDILNDVNVYFTDKGMRILTLDTARVALVDMFLPAENFEEYECPNSIVAGKSLGTESLVRIRFELVWYHKWLTRSPLGLLQVSM